MSEQPIRYRFHTIGKPPLGDIKPCPDGELVNYSSYVVLEQRVKDLETNLLAATATVVDLEDKLAVCERERDRWKKLESEAAECVEVVIIHRSRYFTGEEPYVGWKGLGLALRQDFDERDRLREALQRIANYDQGSECCAYGCDTPSIAQQALKEG